MNSDFYVCVGLFTFLLTLIIGTIFSLKDSSGISGVIIVVIGVIIVTFFMNKAENLKEVEQ